MKILYFGSYKPSYPRNKVILSGLRQNGVDVVECRVSSGFLPVMLIKLLFRYIILRPKFDIMIVAFPGQEVMFLARLITRKPIIFDVFTSHYMGYILDRKYFSEKSLRSKYYRFLDRWSCKLADTVILDTSAHIDFFIREFKLPQKKFKRIWLGANTQLFYPRPRKDDNNLPSVVFWGNFIPLQGIEHIVEAAALLPGKATFYLIGHGQMYDREIQHAQDLGATNINFLGRLRDEELVKWVTNADVCLGAFGGGIKTDLTIQNKIFETLASQRLLVTARTSAIQELLKDNEHVILCNPADPKDLAKKILSVIEHPELRLRIAENGYRFFVEHLSEKKIAAELIHNFPRLDL